MFVEELSALGEAADDDDDDDDDNYHDADSNHHDADSNRPLNLRPATQSTSHY